MPLLRPRLLLVWVALAAGLLALGAKLTLVHSRGSDVPYMDEWDAVGGALLVPQAHGTLGASNFLEPQNEHRVVLSRLISLGLIAANGQWDGLLEMTVNAVLHAAFLVALVLFLGRFLSGYRFTVAVLLTTLLFILAFDWENTLQGFQSQFYLLQWSAFALCVASVPARPLAARWWLGWTAGLLGLATMSSGFLGPLAVLVLLLLKSAVEPRRGYRGLAAALLLAALCAAGLALLVKVPGHEILKAHSPWQWMLAAATALSWPKPTLPLAFVVLQLPLAVLLWQRTRERRIEGDEAVLLALGLWSWMQVAALAYGRANLGMVSSPRYTDVYAVGLVMNLAALGILFRPGPGGWKWGLFAVLWASVFLCGLGSQHADAYRLYLDDFSKEKPLEQAHLRAFLGSGDRSVLRMAPAVELPYPNPEKLAGFLEEPAIQRVLPVSVRPALRLAPVADTQGFAASVDPRTGERIWTAPKGPARFVGAPFPPRTLSYVRIFLRGSPDLGADALRIEPGDGAGASKPLDELRWAYRDLPVPGGAPAHIVVDLSPGNHWIEFTEPVEIGGLSRANHWLLQRSAALASIGGILFGMALTALLVRDCRSRKV